MDRCFIDRGEKPSRARVASYKFCVTNFHEHLGRTVVAVTKRHKKRFKLPSALYAAVTKRHENLGRAGVAVTERHENLGRTLVAVTKGQDNLGQTGVAGTGAWVPPIF